MEDISRQLDELEALEALFCEPGEFDLDDAALRDRLRACVDRADGLGAALEGGAVLSMRLCFGLGGDDSNCDRNGAGNTGNIFDVLSLHITLPHGYPSHDRPHVLVSHPHMDCHSFQEVAEARAKQAQEAGEECVTDIALMLKDLYDQHRAGMEAETQMGVHGHECSGLERAAEVTAELEEETSSCEEDAEVDAATLEALEALSLSQALDASAAIPVLGRRLLYSHHIINPNKRKVVIEWALELGLGGLSKIGWPGVIVVEGPECGCKEYVRRLQHLRWKHLAVRGEQQEQAQAGSGEAGIDGLRRLPRGFQELGKDQMSEMAQKCREAGLEELFLTSMKIYGGRSSGSSAAAAGAAGNDSRSKAKKKGGQGKVKKRKAGSSSSSGRS